MSSPLLAVEHLQKYFPVRRGVLQRVAAHVRAVDDVSFSIGSGKTLGLVGESGCGKSTAGRTLLRLYQPDAGRVVFDGQDVTNLRGRALRALRREMQIVFQDPASSLNPRMTVQTIIEEGLVIHGIGNRVSRRAKADELMDLVGLDRTYLNRYPHEFSGGQRQRISIARALALEPKLIVLDEPISALDVSIQSQIVNLLTRLKTQLGLTYLFISHDLLMVRYISDAVAVMYLGQIVEHGGDDQIYTNPLHPYTLALLSAVPKMIPGRRRDRIVLRGDVPSADKVPTGCRFHPRCPIAMDVCREKMPDLLRIGGEGTAIHTVRCHAVEMGIDTPAAVRDAVAAQSNTPLEAIPV